LNIIIQASGNGSLVVKNNINVKFSPEPGLGLGLSNLSGQFRMLSGQDIAVIKENGFFIVELPLMNLP
jgi:two-component system, LytTR family, sensor kinase